MSRRKLQPACRSYVRCKVPHQLELENQAATESPEIEFRVGDVDAEDFQILEGMEVPQVTAYTDVFAEVADDAAAHVPTEMIVVGFEQRQVNFGVCLQQPEAADEIRLHGAQLRRHH